MEKKKNDFSIITTKFMDKAQIPENNLQIKHNFFNDEQKLKETNTENNEKINLNEEIKNILNFSYIYKNIVNNNEDTSNSDLATSPTKIIQSKKNSQEREIYVIICFQNNILNIENLTLTKSSTSTSNIGNNDEKFNCVKRYEIYYLNPLKSTVNLIDSPFIIDFEKMMMFKKFEKDKNIPVNFEINNKEYKFFYMQNKEDDNLYNQKFIAFDENDQKILGTSYKYYLETNNLNEKIIKENQNKVDKSESLTNKENSLKNKNSIEFKKKINTKNSTDRTKVNYRNIIEKETKICRNPKERRNSLDSKINKKLDNYLLNKDSARLLKNTNYTNIFNRKNSFGNASMDSKHYEYRDKFYIQVKKFSLEENEGNSFQNVEEKKDNRIGSKKISYLNLDNNDKSNLILGKNVKKLEENKSNDYLKDNKSYEKSSIDLDSTKNQSNLEKCSQTLFDFKSIEYPLSIMITISNYLLSNSFILQNYDIVEKDDAFSEINFFHLTQSEYQKYYNFKFYDHSPKIFANLRKFYGVSFHEFIHSLGLDNESDSFIFNGNYVANEMNGHGKSGGCFFITNDKRFIIKSISLSEFEFFKSILEDYYFYIKNNENTLLIKIYGLYTIISNGNKFHYFIMNNVFNPNIKINYIYDIKGSTYSRLSRDVDDINYKMFDFSIPMKDLDLIERNEQFFFTSSEVKALTDQIKKDSDFLANKNINDYSLLIGVHEIEDSQGEYSTKDPLKKDCYIEALNESKRIPFFELYKGGLMTADEKRIIFFGIIDIFTQYDTRKKMEFFFKGFTQGNGISCKPPPEYCERFKSFIETFLKKI